MDPMIRELIIRMRVVNEMAKPMLDAAKKAKELAKQQRDAERLAMRAERKQAREIKDRVRAARDQAREMERITKRRERNEVKAIRDKWREATSLARLANSEERKHHREALKRAKELRERRREMLGNVRGGLSKASSAITSAAPVAGMVGVGLGGWVAKDLLETALAADQAKMAIATMVQSADSIVKGPYAGVNDAFEKTNELIADMRELAKQTPAGFEGIKQAFSDVVVPARMTGASYDDIKALSANMAALNSVYGFEQGVVSRDVQQLLRGDIGEVQTPQLRAIRMQVQKLYKKGDAKGQFGAISKALSLPPEILERFENSPAGMISQLGDEWEQFKIEAGQPILGWLAEELRDALKFVRENREQVKQWAKDLGDGVVDALRWVRDALAWIVENGESIIEWAKRLGIALAAIVAVNGLVSVFQGVIAIAPALGAALSAAFGPIGAAVAGVAAIAVSLKEIFGGPAGDVWLADVLNNSSFRQLREAGAAREHAGTETAKWQELLGKKANARAPDDYKKGGGYFMKPGDAGYADVRIEPMLMGEDIKQYQAYATQAMAYLGSDIDGIRSLAAQTRDGFLVLSREVIAAYSTVLTAAQAGVEALLKAATGEKLTIPNVTNDFRGSKFSITQKVETNNPAMLARQTLIAGYEATARQPIRARSRPGSVGLANGDR